MQSSEKEDGRLINEKLQEVDRLLTVECFLCGPILIDMIDNDIEEEAEDDENEKIKPV